ncbi:MAG: TonB-dependent receptor [Helicobacteraceae bacterium]|nr:TonB-dependent receptor [Helicobacteraceae bacterium]
MKKTSIWFLLLALQGSGNEISDINLGEITTTANKTSSLVSESAGNISVVTKKDIAKTPNVKFSDTLRGLEGVFTSKGRGLETFDSVTIRGISGGTNVLIDGVSINDMNNNTKMLTSMNALDLERVEVIRGPFSNIYGSGALGGVVNFITKMYDELTIKASIGYGNPFQDHNAPQNLVRGFISLGDAYFDKKFKIKASYAFSTSKGYAADEAWTSSTEGSVSGYIPTKSSTGTSRYIVGDMGRQSYGTHDFRLQSKLDIGDNGELSASFNYSNYNYKHIDQKTFLSKDGKEYWGNSSGSANQNGTVGNMPYTFVGGMGNEDYSQFIESIKYKHYFQDQILEFNISRLDGFDYWNGPNADASPFGGSGKQTYTRHQKNTLDLFYTLDLNKSFILLLGMDYKLLSMDIDNNYIADWRYMKSAKTGFAGKSGGDSHFIGAFGDLNMKFLDDTFITSIGGRIDYWIGNNYYNIDSSWSGLPTKGNKKFAFSPKLSFNYNLFQTTLFKASIGQAFRVPTLSQMFSQHILNDGTKILGNPNLKPENATSFDIGIEQKIINNPIKIFYFYTHLSNAIYGDSVKNSYHNAGSARIHGIEIAYKENLIYDLSFHITYTWTNSKMLKNSVNEASVGKKLPGIREHKAYVNLYYQYDHLYSQDSKFYTSLEYEFASKAYNANNSDTIKNVYGATDSYSLFNFRIGMYFNKDFSLNFDITNLFNHKYYSYYKAPGRAFFLSFNYDI